MSPLNSLYFFSLSHSDHHLLVQVVSDEYAFCADSLSLFVFCFQFSSGVLRIKLEVSWNDNRSPASYCFVQ